MIMSIYLSDDVANVLRCYGTLNDVVNKILVAGAEGAIDIMQKPKITERKGGHYYQIRIGEPNYLSLIDIYGASSSKISLRRLLYWFVENEVYQELSWEPCENYIDENINRGYDAIMNLKQDIYKASRLLPTYDDAFTTIRNIINEIEEELWHA